MGFLKRFLSLGSTKSRKNKKKQNAPNVKDVDAEGRILPQRQPRERGGQDPDTSANRLLRSSSTKFSVMSAIDYTAMPPPPLPLDAPSTPSLSPSPSMLTVATTPGVQRSGTYVVKVHGRTTHSRTEFPRANPPPSPTKQSRVAAEPKTPLQDKHDTEDEDDDDDADEPRGPRLKAVNFTPKDNSRIYALRQDPSVVSLLNMYDDQGCLDTQAFASTPPAPAPISTRAEGRQPRQRTGSTLRQLLGEQQPVFIPDIHASEGDISWAERFLDEQLRDDSPLSSPALTELETPKDALFSDDLSEPRVAADTTLSSLGADSSVNYPAISSMEVEVSGTEEDMPVDVAPAPKPTIEPKTPQRASEVFGFLNRRNTVSVKERDLPDLPRDLSPQITGASDDDAHDAHHTNTSLEQPSDATHSANTSHSAPNTSGDTQSHLSHAQIHTATMTKLSSAFAASTLSLNLLNPPEEGTDSVPPAQSHRDTPISQTDAHQAQQPTLNPTDDDAPLPIAGPSVQAQGPRHHYTGSSLSSSSSMKLPPSKIPRGPRPRPLSVCKRDETGASTMPATQSEQPIAKTNDTLSASQSASTRSAKREAFTNIPQRQHRRITSRSSDAASDHSDENAVAPTRTPTLLKTPGPSSSYGRKRPTKPSGQRAHTLGKENTPSPPRAPAGLGFATPVRARTFAGHVLEREDWQVPPSPASSSELSPVAQDMMSNLRMQRMRARQVERRKGIWVRE